MLLTTQEETETRRMNKNRLQQFSRSFYARNTHTVATSLLGKLLVRRWRGKTIIAHITEVESYVGENDAACHASRGRTPRTEVMFGEAGHAYVYLVYGMYHCLNIVTEKKDFPAAVLIRSAVPVQNVPNNIDGPGKLCRELRINRSLNGENLVRSGKLYIAADGFRVPKSAICSSARIGVEYAGKDAKFPWRYYVDKSLTPHKQIKW
jgi:DNA-3-methyladenine glycosylase